MWTPACVRLLCVVHFCGHLRVFVCYVLSTFVDTCECSSVMCCPLLWTRACVRLLCVVHFSGHLRVLVYYVLSTIVDTCVCSFIMSCPLLWTPQPKRRYRKAVSGAGVPVCLAEIP